ncbi:ABC transporter substrate-binding protein [Dyadobacter sp. CY312]|uniref:ABC transporter substrate-binding protein n=1 Tax=Dyadobacter sp. CY312 TaxID=2907303 RepID=UPI001F3F8EFD|nr:ABC transporter substrate-binding protein [Dyadobacter sp. CY312]MCE7041043.1 ABC transporter substrate-binding protein [Dyadobacter sp. CY312]
MKEFIMRRILLLIWLTVGFIGCKTKERDSNEQNSKNSSQNFFKERVEIKHAKGFSIEYFDNYKIVKIISPFEKTTDTTKYILVQRGTTVPDILKNNTVIEMPIRSLALTSSMHIGLLSYLNSEHVLTGLSSLQYVFSPKVIAMIDSGKVAEVGKDQGINEEKLISIHPDLIMTTGSPSSKLEHYQLLSDAGIPVISNSEWVENTPLGRAEWVKLMAAFLNEEALVNEKFAKTEAEYERLAKLAGSSKNKPLILSGLNTKDVWFMPNGNSYMARFFKDAGGNFPSQATKDAGSLPLSFESVYPTALKADFWVNVGFDSRDTRNSILRQDKRYADFNAFKTGKMYSYNNRTNSRGSNDFFETGNVEPDVVLADLIHIFHPELLPDHTTVYYKQLK